MNPTPAPLTMSLFKPDLEDITSVRTYLMLVISLCWHVKLFRDTSFPKLCSILKRSLKWYCLATMRILRNTGGTKKERQVFRRFIQRRILLLNPFVFYTFSLVEGRFRFEITHEASVIMEPVVWLETVIWWRASPLWSLRCTSTP